MRRRERAFLSTEFWQDKRLNSGEFLSAFARRFPAGEVSSVVENPEPASHRPNHRLLVLVVPKDQSTRLEAFLANYARTHNADLAREPRSSFAD